MTIHRFVFAALCAAGLYAADIAGAQPVLLTAPTTIGPLDTTVTPTGGGAAVPLATAQITVQNTTLTINGRHSIAALTLLSGGIVRHAPAFTFDYSGDGSDVVNGLQVTVTGDATVANGCTIDVTGLGHPSGVGPGAGQNGVGNTGGNDSGSGGGYGGNGQSAGTQVGGLTYGSFAEPTDLGSGGGANTSGSLGGAGGGAVRLEVGGTLTIDGVVRSNGAGASTTRGSGSGGSIWITAQSIAGTGTIEANGGGTGARGGGGRVALYSGEMAFTGIVRSQSGGTGAGVGTLYQSVVGQSPVLIFDNGGTGSINTQLASPLVVQGDVVVRGGARLGHPASSATGLSITTMGNVTIEATGTIDVTGLGHPSGVGPGAGQNGVGISGGNDSGSGGGYGGNGQSAGTQVGGLTYGSFAEPTDLGSGGGANTSGSLGGAGGGAVRLEVGGTLTIDGVVRSNGAGASTTRGSGSGGSIWITAQSIAGTGTIEANGGGTGARGGGGRIAIYRCFDSFTGIVRALRGGTGAGDGTVFISEAGAEIAPLVEGICNGQTAVLNAFAGGVGNFTYQWLRNGVALADGPMDFGSVYSGVATSQLTIENITGFDSGNFTVRITASCGEAESEPLVVSICAPDFDCSGGLDDLDIALFFTLFEEGDLVADLDGSGSLDDLDISVFFNTFESGC